MGAGRFTPVPERVYCPDCGEADEFDTFEDALSWNLEHILLHNPQPDLTIVIGPPDAPREDLRYRLKSTLCHLCNGKKFVNQDSLRGHVRHVHEMNMPEFRASDPAGGERLAA